MRAGWRGVLGILLSALLLYWVFRETDPAEVWEVLRRSRVGFFAVAAVIATAVFPVRAWRWRFILHDVVPNMPFGPLWRATAIGTMANNVLPARAGEFARGYALSREDDRIRFSTALASLVVDRLFDAIVLLLLLIVVTLAPGFPRGTVVGGRTVEEWALVLSVVAIVGLAGLMVLALRSIWIIRVWEALVGRVSPRVARRGRGLLEGFASGVGVLRDPKQSAVVFVLTAAQWILNGASFWIAFHAVGIDAPFRAAIFLQSLLALGVAIPAAPGFFGLFEAFALVALSVYGVEETIAISYAIGYHVLSFIPITVIGLWYVGRLGLHFRELRGAEN